MTRLIPLPIALFVATLLVTLMAMPVALLASAPVPPRGGVVLVVAPPWAPSGGPSGVVSAAGGREIGPLRAPFAVLAVLDDASAEGAQGAWAVLDGRWLAALCGAARLGTGEGTDLD